MRAIRLRGARTHNLQGISLDIEPGTMMVVTGPSGAGKSSLAFGTLYASPYIAWTHPDTPNPNGYRTPEEAEAQGLAQLAVYEGWEARGRVRIVKSRNDLEHHLELWATDRTPGLIVLMEGADPIKTPDEVSTWWDRGVRIIGTSWGPTRYAGGTGSPGGLTNIGRELIAAMRAQKITLDISHQAWESFWDSMEVGPYRVCLLYTSPSPRDRQKSRMPSSA